MTENRKDDWVNVKDELPNTQRKVLKYSSHVNIAQENIAVSISEAFVLKHCDETVYWMDITKLPVPLILN